MRSLLAPGLVCIMSRAIRHNLAHIVLMFLRSCVAGIFMLKTLRDRGYKAVIYEAGNDLGGTWRWNCYPGAGVDSEVPEYEFSWPEVWKTWNWTTNYPNYKDLRAYFDHVDKVIGIKKDCSFNTVVVGATFDTAEGKWNVRTEDGRTAKARFLILGTGFVSRAGPLEFFPNFPFVYLADNS